MSALPEQVDVDAEVTAVVMGIHAEQMGCRPADALTFHDGSVVVTVMSGVLNLAERRLIGADRQEELRRARQLMRSAFALEMRSAVERVTGRRVVALIAADELQADRAVEVFVLDAPV